MVELLERGHMARPEIDDAIAVKWCDNFIKDLDPGKYYFLKADVEEFKKEATTLDDQIREGNIDFAKKVFERYPAAAGRAVQDLDGAAQAEARLHGRRVSVATIPTRSTIPVDKAEADERLRKKVKFDLLFSKVVEDVDDAEAVEQVDDPLSRPQPAGPPDRHQRAAASLSDRA